MSDVEKEERHRHEYHLHMEDRWCHGKVKKKDTVTRTQETQTEGMVEQYPPHISTYNHYNTQRNASDIDTDDLGFCMEGAAGPASPNRQYGEERNEPNCYRTDELKRLSDDEILRLLPKSTKEKHNAKRITRCKQKACTSASTEECQGYCNTHFCEFARSGSLSIPRHQSQTQAVFEDEALPLSIPRVDTNSSSSSPDQSPTRFNRTSKPSHRISAQREQISKIEHTKRHPAKQWKVQHREFPTVTQRVDTSSGSSSPNNSPPTPRGIRDPRRRHHGNSNIIESGEDENVIQKPKSRRSRSSRKPTTVQCIGPSCYNDAEPGKLCRQCEQILTNAKFSGVPSPVPTSARRDEPIARPPVEVNVNVNPRSEKPRRQRNDFLGPEIRMAPQAYYGDNNRPLAQPRQAQHTHNSRYYDAIPRDSYFCETCTRGVPRHQCCCDPHLDHQRRTNFPGQSTYERPPYQPQYMHGEHHHESGPPSSMLTEASSSLSIEEREREEMGLAESFSPYAKQRKRCIVKRCSNYGNEKCGGYCNECFNSRSYKRQ